MILRDGKTCGTSRAQRTIRPCAMTSSLGESNRSAGVIVSPAADVADYIVEATERKPAFSGAELGGTSNLRTAYAAPIRDVQDYIRSCIDAVILITRCGFFCRKRLSMWTQYLLI
jgi:hypothetical protein